MAGSGSQPEPGTAPKFVTELNPKGIKPYVPRR